MELALLAFYSGVSLLLYMIVDFKLKKNEECLKILFSEKNSVLESGLRRLEDDYQRSLATIQADITTIKNKLP